jgi:hypothetical protein
MQQSINDLTGQVFGPYTVLRRSAFNYKDGTAQWDCRCKCGTEHTFKGTHLRRSAAHSSGCEHCYTSSRMLPPGVAVFRRALKVYRKNAKTRGYPWDLTEQQFAFLISQNCRYCGGPGGGVDRVDNTRGYSPDNVVPCCRKCNRAKDTMTHHEYIDRCCRIADIHREGRQLLEEIKGGTR